MPQLELQQTCPSWHLEVPHLGPGGRQNSLVHPLPGATQYPQLELQHSKPALQTVGPHGVSLGRSSGRQTSWVHIMPGFVQRPQEALQHVRPRAQMLRPHSLPLTETHLARPSTTSHVVPDAQRTVEQGVMPSGVASGSVALLTARLLTSTGLAEMVTATESRANTLNGSERAIMATACFALGIYLHG